MRRLFRSIMFLGLAMGLSIGAANGQTPHQYQWPAIPANAVNGFGLNLAAADLATLQTKGELNRFHKGGPAIELCPSPKVRDGLLAGAAQVKADLNIETLLALPIPAGVKNRADLPLLMYNILHRFKTMEGIQYWSESRNELRTFFTKSAIVKSDKDRAPLPDPVYPTIEDFHRLYALQEDSSFGSNLYAVEVLQEDAQTLHVRMRNLEQVWYGIVPAIGGNSIDLHLVLAIRGDWVLFYGEAALAAPHAFGLEEKVSLSFYNRLVALYTWFGRELAKG